jgi:undecaprenyl pyrophosphate phosphatase UppP
LVVVQLGAILAVVVIYWRKFFNIELDKRLIVAFVPTGIIGLALYSVVKTYLLGNNWVVLAALFLGGFALIVFEHYHERMFRMHGEREHDADLAAMPYKTAALIGLAQAVAIIPGISRSGATIVGGLYLGFAVLFAWAAWTLEPTLVRAVSVAWLLTASLHLLFHAGHLESFGAADAIAEIVSLALLLAPPPLAIWGVAATDRR